MTHDMRNPPRWAGNGGSQRCSPGRITVPKHPTGQVLISYPRMVFDALEATARERVRQMIVHKGANPMDARASTDIENAVRDSVRAGVIDLDTLDAARALLETANTKYQRRAATGRPHTEAAAKAAASTYTPRMVRETWEEYQR